MPFIKIDAGMYDEILENVDPDDLPPDFAARRPSGEFEYEAAEARFDPDKMTKPARLARDAQIAIGATTFRVRYDGGGDEGFSHADSVTINGSGHPAEVVAKHLGTPAFAAQFRDAAVWPDAMYGNAADVYRDATDEQAAGYALEELAHALASRLLGDGFGTGEYTLFGAFTADLRTGEIMDHADAEPPPGGME